MYDGNKLKNEGYVNKCSGIPMYPREHSIFKKRIEGLSEEYIKNREKRVLKFLKEHGFDLNIEG